MAQPAYVQAGTLNDNGASSTITIPKPAGATTDNVLMAWIAWDNVATITNLNGWALGTNSPKVSPTYANVQEALVTRTVEAGAPASWNITLNIASTNVTFGMAWEYSAGTVNVTNANTVIVPTTTPVATGVTLPTTSETVVILWQPDSSGWAGMGAPTGQTKRYDDGIFIITDSVVSASGATGNFTATAGAAGVDVGCVFVMALANLGQGPLLGLRRNYAII